MKNLKQKLFALSLCIVAVILNCMLLFTITEKQNTLNAVQYSSGVWYDVYGWGHCYIYIYGDSNGTVQSGNYSEPEILEYAVWGRWANSIDDNKTWQGTSYCTEPRNAGSVDEPKIRYVSGPDYGVKVNGIHIYSGNTNWVDVPVNESYYYSGGTNNGTILRQSIGQQKKGTTYKDLFCFSFEITKNKNCYTAWGGTDYRDASLAKLGEYAYTVNANQTTAGNGSKTYFHFNYFPEGWTYLSAEDEVAKIDRWYDNKAGYWKYCESLDDANSYGHPVVNYADPTKSTIYVTVHSDQLGIKAYLNSDGGYKPENDTPSNNQTCGEIALLMLHNHHCSSPWNNYNSTYHVYGYCDTCGCEMISEFQAGHQNHYGFSQIITSYGVCGGSKGYYKCAGCGYTKDEWDNRYGHNPVASGNYAATCTTTGWKDRTVCNNSNCNTVINAGSSIPAKGHSFGNYTTTKAATCTTDGSKQRKCSVCGYTETATIPKTGHSPVLSGNYDATCTTTGWKDKTVCNRSGCGVTINAGSKIDALGHSSPSDYSYATNNSIANGLRYKNCTRCSTRLETAYLVTLEKGIGINTVTEKGYFAKGASVTVNATLLSKTAKYTYNWLNWTGTLPSNEQKYTFTMPENAVSLKANGTQTINQYTVTCIDKIIDNSGKTLGTSTWKADYETTVSGATKGTDKTVGKYYTGFYYDSYRTAEVTENGATVYRYFKSEQININGTVEWENDVFEGGNMPYRPKTVELQVSQGNNLVEKITLDTTKTNYTSKLVDKYDKNGNLYTYTVKQILDNTSVLSWNSSKKEYETILAYSITQTGYDFINTLNDIGIPVKPEYTYSLTMDLEFNDSIDWKYLETNKSNIETLVTLKRLVSTTENGEVKYSNEYDGIEINAIVTENSVTISNLLSGKYEIEVYNETLDLENITYSGSQNISIKEENGIYYLIINPSTENSSGAIVIHHIFDNNYGYISYMKKKNLYK